jgi:hypothetical protein
MANRYQDETSEAFDTARAMTLSTLMPRRRKVD